MSTSDFGEFDNIVIGGGTAGCLLANRLSADAKRRVLLLEAGARDNYIWIRIPVGYLYCIGNPRVDWGFKTEAEAGLNGRRLNYPRGKVLGGCSSINGMIYMRGQARDYDLWRQLGNEGWSWTDVLPLFKKHEDYYAGADEFHGAGGEWRVEAQRVRWDILDAFRDAAAMLGIPKIDDFNRGDNFGSSYFRVNQRRGWRWNAARAFLRPVLGRANLRVQTGAQVEAIDFEDNRASVIRFSIEGQRFSARIRHEAVLAAGAIGSPQILELSGIGDGARLQKAGISCRRHLPGVGENLQDHLQLRCIYRISGAPTLNIRAGSWYGKLGIGLEYALFRSGPMSMAPSQLGVFAKSGERQDTADLQYHVQPLSLDRFGDPLHAFPAFTASVCHLRPTSRGSVHLRSNRPLDPPEIRPNYLSTEHDRQIAAEAILLTRRIVAAEPLRRFNPVEFKPGTGASDLVQAAGDIGTTIFHPVGTAKMGRDPLAVVDPQLKLHGLEGLRVADASIMPQITSGNTNSPTLMIAEKAAAMMLA